MGVGQREIGVIQEMTNWFGLGWDGMVVTRGAVVERRGVMCVGLAAAGGFGGLWTCFVQRQHMLYIRDVFVFGLRLFSSPSSFRVCANGNMRACVS